MSLVVGQQAPDFSAIDQESNEVSLGSLCAGRGVILVFYPRNNTPLCTMQLCEMRNWHTQLIDAGWNVVGVNSASRTSSQKFHKRLKLPFPILIDSDGAIAEKYEARWFGLLPRRRVVAVDINGRVRFIANGKPTPQNVLRNLNA